MQNFKTGRNVVLSLSSSRPVQLAKWECQAIPGGKSTVKGLMAWLRVWIYLKSCSKQLKNFTHTHT